jgi:hypothetical protein
MVTQILQRLVLKNHKKVENSNQSLRGLKTRELLNNLFQIDLRLMNQDRIVADDEGWGVDARGIHERINELAG